MAATNGEDVSVRMNPVAAYKRPKNPFKVAFSGVSGVGKTSLFKRMLKEGFSEEKTPFALDKGIYNEVFEKEEIVIPLEIWDTVDMEKYDSITESYYRGSRFVLLVYSADDEYSLHKLAGIAKNVKFYEPIAKLVLVKNKIDLHAGNEIIPEDKEKSLLRAMRKEHAIFKMFETSAKKNEGVENLLQELGKHLLKVFKSRRPCDEEDENDDPFKPYLQPERKSSSCCGN